VGRDNVGPLKSRGCCRPKTCQEFKVEKMESKCVGRARAGYGIRGYKTVVRVLSFLTGLVKHEKLGGPNLSDPALAHNRIDFIIRHTTYCTQLNDTQYRLSL